MDQLSTHGLLAHLTSDEVANLIEGLVVLDCVKQASADGTAQFRPVVRLTPLGGAIMRGEQSLPAELPVDAALARKLCGLPPEAGYPLAAEQTPDPATREADYYWTWRLLSAGFPPDECAAARRLPLPVVLQHALQAVEAGHRLAPGQCFAPELLRALRHIVGSRPITSPDPFLARLPANTLAEHVRLYAAVRENTPP